MIDIENAVFNQIATAVREVYPGIFIAGEYVKAPTSFPAIMLCEVDNAVLRRTQNTGGMENHAWVTYELNVYSNKKNGKKDECREIVALIDTQMAALGFTRMMLNPVPNMEDATIYRMTGRYRAVIDNNNNIYRR